MRGANAANISVQSQVTFYTSAMTMSVLGNVKSVFVILVSLGIFNNRLSPLAVRTLSTVCCLCMYLCAYLCAYLCMCVRACVYVYIYVCVCVCVCVTVCVRADMSTV